MDDLPQQLEFHAFIGAIYFLPLVRPKDRDLRIFLVSRILIGAGMSTPSLTMVCPYMLLQSELSYLVMMVFCTRGQLVANVLDVLN